jgi:hypothetical protein
MGVFVLELGYVHDIGVVGCEDGEVCVIAEGELAFGV